MKLSALDKIRKKLLKITRSSPWLIVEEEKLTVVIGFKIPTGKEDPLSVERYRIFEELLRVVSTDYLFSGGQKRIIIEKERDIGRLLIEFSQFIKY